jgi:N-formylglutamate amidohydrolase
VGAGHPVPGHDFSPVLLHVPHAGTQIPTWTRPHLLLADHEPAAEVAALTDHHTDRIAAGGWNPDLAAISPGSATGRA